MAAHLETGAPPMFRALRQQSDHTIGAAIPMPDVFAAAIPCNPSPPFLRGKNPAPDMFYC